MVGKVRYGWAEWLGKPIKFKPISFFCAVSLALLFLPLLALPLHRIIY